MGILAGILIILGLSFILGARIDSNHNRHGAALLSWILGVILLVAGIYLATDGFSLPPQ